MLELFYNKNKEYKKEELPVRLILTILPHDKDKIILTSIDEIGYYMTGRFLDSQDDKRLIVMIKEGIQFLIDSGEIICIEKNKNNYILDGDSCKVDIKKFNFTIIELWELQKIMSLGINGLGVLQFFLNLIGTINYTQNGNKSFNLSQENMCDYWGTNYMTINKYNTILEELELIYIHKPNLRKKDGTFHKVNNCYGRYRDIKQIIIDSQEYTRKIESYYINLHINRTSIKLQYNAFCKGAKKYKNDNKLILSLYNECEKYNKSLISQKNDNLNPLDLSVFDKYLYEIALNKTDDDIWGEEDKIIA